MVKLSNLLIVVFLVVVGGCTENEDAQPVPIEFLTVSVDPDYIDRGEMFLFVTDSSGQILGEQPVTPGSTAIFETISPPDKVNLTIAFPSINFYTIAGLSKGEKITIDEPGHSMIPPVSGAATINIQNCAGMFFNLSDEMRYSQAAGHSNSSVDATVELRQASSKILVASRKVMDQPVYGWVDNVVNGGYYPIDFNALTPYPKKVSVAFAESVSASIRAGKTTGGGFGYMMTNDGFSKDPEDPKPQSVAVFGYVDGFNDYIFSVSETTSTLPNYYRVATIHKVGASLPETVTLPTNTLSVANSSIKDFRFTYSSTFTFAIHQWRMEMPDNNLFFWTVYSDSPSVSPITELPEAIVAKYPWLSLNSLKHFTSAFSKTEDDYTLRKFIQGAFEGKGEIEHNFSRDYFQAK